MENLRGILFMILAMAGFAFEDLFIKMLSAYFPISEVIMILGFTGSIVFLIIAIFQNAPIIHKDLLDKYVIMRTICELLGAVFFVTAIALTPLSSASAILQITPLLVTIGAVIFFREKVGWRRWSAVFVGFMGVLLILRPGFGGFMPASIFALLGSVFLAARDLSTRAMKVDLPSVTIALYAFIAFGISGILIIPFNSPMVIPSLNQIMYFIGASTFGVFAYYSLVISSRIGEMSVISPFRYSRIVFAMLLAIIILGERPDSFTLIGAAIIVLSGMYTFVRENLLKKSN
ncbi:DMT family transporter [Candidatus Thioglobus sp. NP1]|jgi:drug/metabolite transporter (DMT)-like permease|uniref:DMT family transporter n=1 Tax=Candidatus Thioglobus sp. NP1 TaxID=2508687 RepID=UPI000DED3AA1|nr:DMT family transporter [Candidatus Thioglobus sp. NP1]AXE61238.1 EamA family transporter [Candidatus Thioglobus sp. NP1]|tara:strand:- start:438 stop:1304 length:867 start_codon:yes stop_codon:yes gene_type:complete